MDLSSNKRLTRICNVLDRSEWLRNIQSQEIKTDNRDFESAGMEKLKREFYRCVAYNPSCLPFEKRLEKLRKWDEYLFVTEGMNEFLRFLESVNAVESSVNALEDKLFEQGVEINEKLFRDLCEGKLQTPTTATTPAGIGFRPEIKMAPICTSTPEREISSKMFIKEEPMHFVAATPELPVFVSHLLNNNDSCETIAIGPNGTSISRKALQSINWCQTGANITRKLLMEIFDRQTLASHTLSGKPSPAFLGCNKPLKQQLDEKKVKDLTYMVTHTFNMTEKEVRQAITTKCADENKMFRQRMEKMRNKLPKENRGK